MRFQRLAYGVVVLIGLFNIAMGMGARPAFTQDK